MSTAIPYLYIAAGVLIAWVLIAVLAKCAINNTSWVEAFVLVPIAVVVAAIPFALLALAYWLIRKGIGML